MMSSKDMKNDLANSLESHFPKILEWMNSKYMKNDLANILESYFPKKLGFRLATCKLLFQFSCLE